MSATIKEIAYMLGLSTATVSRSLNDKPGISEATRRRVKELAEKLEYQPSGIARSLVTQRTNTIGFLMSEYLNPIYLEIGQHMEAIAADKGYTIIFASAREDPERKVRELRNRGVDGLIIARVAWPEGLDYLWRLKQARTPVTLLGSVDAISMDSVSVDRAEGVYLAVRHLIELGHTRIGYMCYPNEVLSIRSKYVGFEKALAEARLPLRQEWIVRGLGDRENGYESMKSMLDMDDRPTAVFFHNDFAVIGAMKAVREAGLRVPDDISIIGFDNIKDGEYLDPPLTTVNQPKDKLACLLIETLMKRIEQPDLPLQQTVLKPELIFRGSCSRPPVGSHIAGGTKTP